MKTAIIIGATGLTGKALLYQLLDDKQFNTIILFLRKELNISHPKLVQHCIDFNALETCKDLIKGDVDILLLGNNY
jgi:N-acetyl-gamma-glutamylphosphate reductase